MEEGGRALCRAGRRPNAGLVARQEGKVPAARTSGDLVAYLTTARGSGTTITLEHAENLTFRAGRVDGERVADDVVGHVDAGVTGNRIWKKKQNGI